MENNRNKKRRSVSFTEDLVTEIISYVFAKDLMRFKCVSKSWNFLICNDPYFSRLQIKRSASQQERTFLFFERLVKSISGEISYRHYWIDLDSIEDGNPNRRLTEIHHSLIDHAYVIGSCHGLLVLRPVGSHILEMILYNPTTKKHLVVPQTPSPPPSRYCYTNVVFCGFGYDHVHDCYKLVAKRETVQTLELLVYEVTNTGRGVPTGVQTSNLKGGERVQRPSDQPLVGTWTVYNCGSWWREYEDRYDYSRLCSYGVQTVNGAVYWCVEETVEVGPSEMRMMVCFILAEGKLEAVMPPDLGEVKYCPVLAVLDGRLGMGCQQYNLEMHEIWMMDMECDCNKVYSWRWTKFLSISNPAAMLPPPHYLNLVHSDVALTPKCFSACKSKILYHIESDFFWYDLEKKEFRELNNPINNYTYDDHVVLTSCVPSLVGIDIF